MDYRSALLGCGPRGRSHAAAYRHIKEGTLVAACDLDQKRLQSVADEFGIANRYTDLHEMLEREKPDVVHCVTDPTLRVQLMTTLSDAGVPGVIVEKPVCIGADDYLQLRNLDKESNTKFVVNHQLRHHPKILEFLKIVDDGDIGKVRFIDASSVYPMAGQGPHILDLMFAFNGYASPISVFGTCCGYDDIDGRHPSPATAELLITFQNGCRAAFMAGAGAPVFEEGQPWMHKRVAVYGTHGYLHWRMNAWERSLPGGIVEAESKEYSAEDILGQAGLTKSLFTWLDRDEAQSPTNLGVSLDEWLVILAGYLSTVESRPIEFPLDPPRDLLTKYRKKLGME